MRDALHKTLRRVIRIAVLWDSDRKWVEMGNPDFDEKKAKAKVA